MPTQWGISAGLTGGGAFGDESEAARLYRMTGLPPIIFEELRVLNADPSAPISLHARAYLGRVAEALWGHADAFRDENISHDRKHTLFWQDLEMGEPRARNAFEKYAAVLDWMEIAKAVDAGYRPDFEDPRSPKAAGDGNKRAKLPWKNMTWDHARKMMRRAWSRIPVQVRRNCRR